MLRVLLPLLITAPLAAQSPADTAAVRAAALRESPTPDSGTVTRLVIRGDTAEVRVLLARGEDREWGHTLQLVRQADGRWVALPRRTLFMTKYDR